MNQKKGFSPIEVLIALAILAILAGGVWVWRSQKRAQPTTLSIPSVTPKLRTPPGVTEAPLPPTTIDQLTPQAEKIDRVVMVKNKELWYVDLGTNEEHLLQNAPAGARLTAPKLSPDYTKLAYIEYLEKDAKFIIKVLTFSPNTQTQEVARSNNYLPLDWVDNINLAYAADRQVRLFSLTAQSQEVLTTANNPVEKLIYRNGYLYYSSKSGVSRVYLSTKRVEPLFEGFSSFDVNNTGSQMAVARDVTQNEYDPQVEIWLTDSQGNPIQQVTTFSGYSSLGTLQFFPDDRHLIVVIHGPGDSIDPRVYDISDEQKTISEVKANGYLSFWRAFSFRPEGDKYIAIDSKPYFSIGPYEEIYLAIFDIEGQMVKKLKDLSGDATGHITEFDWGKGTF